MSDPEVSNATTIQTAQQAFDRFAQGWETGDFQPFIDMLTDDALFWLPVGKQQGKPFGHEGKPQIIARLKVRADSGDRLTLHAPENITSNDTTVIFEFESQGTIHQQPYIGRNAISFDVKGDKICEIREYFGGIE